MQSKTGMSYGQKDLMRLMEDIEVIRELEKLLGVKAIEITQDEWGSQKTPTNQIRYQIVNRKIQTLFFNAPNLKNSIGALFELIKNFDSLTELNLSDNDIDVIPESIGDIKSLRHLYLSWNRLTEIPNSITNLVSLTILSLSLNGFNKIPAQITALSSLRDLNLSLNGLEEIPENIDNLISLTNFNLTGNNLKRIPESITDLSYLRELNLSGNQLEEIPDSINKLKFLTDLNLIGNQLKKIPESITKLKSLRYLNLGNNQISINIEQLKQIIKLPKLKALVLTENTLPIPKEVFEGISRNCLQDLRNYFQDGDNHGWSENNELKIILIGNGGTGKTSLVNRLVHNTFDETYKSTHAINLNGKYSKPYIKLEPYTINIWDFAGQDIYHATHRLFMQTRALFLILWDNETENQEYSTVKEYGKKRDYKNYKLDYWLNYVKVLGKGSHALIIQSKAIRDEKKVPPNAQELKDIYKNVWIDNPISIDSKEDSWIRNGYKQLLVAIENAIEETNLLGKEQLPNNWVINRDEFHKLQDERTKKISYEDFTTMCKGKESVNPDTLLHWLVDSGVVFYREGLFNNQIIIDQQWAINAVYTLFDRKKGYYQLKDQKGKFTNEDLQEFWEEYSLPEQKLFLSYMLSCEICYEVDNVYIAPALLPEDKPPILDSFWEGKESYFVKYEMLFFHYGTMQSFLVRLGNMQLDALIEVELWQYGILFKYNENTYALVEAKPDDKQIIVRVSGQDTKILLDKIRNLIEEIQGKEGITESFSKDGEIYFDEKDEGKSSERKKFFEKDVKNTFEDKMNLDIQEIKETIKRIDKTTQDTHIDLKSLIVKFSDSILEIKQSLSFRKEDDEERINRLNEIIDNHRLLLEKDKNQRLTYAKEKAQIGFEKFSSLQTDSQTFIAMGFYFLEILPDNGDFSPAALQFCRALELEMKIVFMNFKNSSFVHLQSYPSHNNLTYTKFQGFVNEGRGLALGEMIHIISDISIHQSRALFSDFGNFMSNWKTNNDLAQFLAEVHIFKTGNTSPRNKSAHTHPLSRSEAEDCKNLVLRALSYWLD